MFSANKTIMFVFYESLDMQVGNYCPHCNRTILFLSFPSFSFFFFFFLLSPFAHPAWGIRN